MTSIEIHPVVRWRLNALPACHSAVLARAIEAMIGP
jgi:hypothetical protein